jgi:outer membrane lipoprotein-sorting protein
MVSVRSACLIFLLAAQLPRGESENIQREFERKQASTSSYKADFKQTLRLSGVRDPVVSSGKFVYVAPDQMLIEFLEPKGEFMMISKGELYYKKRSKPLEQHKLESDRQSGPVMLLELFRNGGKSLHEHYNVDMSSDANRLLVTLTRKDDDEDFPSKIENKLLRESLKIQSVRVYFGEDESMLYEFLNPARNVPVDPDLFHPEHH